MARPDATYTAVVEKDEKKLHPRAAAFLLS